MKRVAPLASLRTMKKMRMKGLMRKVLMRKKRRRL